MNIVTYDWKRYGLEFCGYEVITTFGNDFDIADAFGAAAITDTYNRAMAEWKTNYKYLTELALILNWKCWQHHGKNEEYSRLYADLYYKTRGYALDNLKGEELTYYYETTD